MTAGWLTSGQVSQVARYWPGAVDLDLDELGALLASAAVQCDAYAPQITITIPVDGVDTEVEGVAPGNYLHGQVLQARALYRSTMAGSGDQIGLDGQAVQVFPMDWTVKLLLRPKGRPRVG